MEGVLVQVDGDMKPISGEYAAILQASEYLQVGRQQWLNWYANAREKAYQCIDKQGFWLVKLGNNICRNAISSIKIVFLYHSHSQAL